MSSPPSRLTIRLQQMIEEQGGLRPAAAFLKVPHSTLKRWIDEGKPPEYENISTIARGLKLPVWQVLEMAGVSLELPTDQEAQIRRLLAIVSSDPQLIELIKQLAIVRTDAPDLTDRAIGFLAFELSRRGITMPMNNEEPTSALMASAETGEKPLDETDYIEIVRKIAAEIEEQDRQSFREAVQNVIQRFRRKRPDRGEEPRERPV